MSSSNNNNRSNNTSTPAAAVAGGGRDGRGGEAEGEGGHTAAAAAGTQQRHTQPQQHPRQHRAALGSGLGTFFEELLPDEVRRRAADLAAAAAGGGGGGASTGPNDQQQQQQDGGITSNNNSNNKSIPYDLRVDQLEGLDEYLSHHNASTGAAMSSSSSSPSSMFLLGCEVSNQRWSSNKDVPLKRKQTLVEYALQRMKFFDDDGDDDDDGAGSDDEEGDEVTSESSHRYQQKTSTTTEEDNDAAGGDNDDDEEEEEEEEEEEMMCETQPALDDAVETQPLIDPKEGHGKSGDDCSRSSKMERTNKKKTFHHTDKVRPVDETTFDVTNFEHVNLKTRNLTVTGPESQSLCRVLMLWPLRSTRRFFSSSYNEEEEDDDEEEDGHHLASSYDDGDDDDRPSELAEIFPSRNHNALPRYRHRYGQDDGPAGVGHNHVLSLEVEQRFFTSVTATATPTLPSSTSHPANNKRMVIFLYDEYAWMVHDWLLKQQQKGKLGGKSSSLSSLSSAEYIMDLSKIPAKCIFPYAIDPRSWIDRASLIEYCLCIAPVNSVYKEICKAAAASSSPSNPTDGPEDEEKIRLDSADMRLRIASVTNYSTSPLATKMSVENNEQLVLTKETMVSKYVQRQDSVDAPSTKRRRTAQAQARAQPQNGSDDANQEKEEATLRDIWMAHQPGQRQDDEDLGSYEPFYDDDDSTTPLPEPIIFEGKPTRNSVYRQGQRCEYKSLKDLKKLMDDYTKNKLNSGRGNGTEISPFFVNVYAVVRNFTIPRRPNGLDWYAKLELIDETTSCANDKDEDEKNEKVEPITLVAFRRELELLPRIVSVGDVIRIHRARLQTFNGTQLQLVIRGRNEYCGSSVVLRKDGNRWKARATANKEFTFDKSDALKMQALWNWGHDYSMKKPIINAEHKFSIGDIPSMEIDGTLNTSVKDKDAVVMVIGMYPNPNDHLPAVYGFLRIWDGTGDDYEEFLVDTLFTQEMKRRKEPSSDAVEKVARLVNEINDKSKGNSDDEPSIEIPCSLCGRVINAAIWEKELWEFCQQNLNVGSFIMLRNVDIKVHPNPDLRTINIHNRSWLVPLPDRCFDVQQLLRLHNERIPDQYNPRAALLPWHSPYNPNAVSGDGDSSSSDPLTVNSFSSFKQSVDADVNFSGTVQLDSLRRHGNKHVVDMSDIICGGSISAYAAQSCDGQETVKEFLEKHRLSDGSSVGLGGVAANVVLVGVDVSNTRFVVVQSISLCDSEPSSSFVSRSTIQPQM